MNSDKSETRVWMGKEDLFVHRLQQASNQGHSVHCRLLTAVSLVVWRSTCGRIHGSCLPVHCLPVHCLSTCTLSTCCIKPLAGVFTKNDNNSRQRKEVERERKRDSEHRMKESMMLKL